MAQIANARSFDGDDDIITMSHGTLEQATSDFTFAAIVKPVGTIPTNSFAYSELIVSGTSFPTIGMQSASGGIMAFFYAGEMTANAPSIVADEWQMIAATLVGGGSFAPRMHRYIYDTDSWAHQDGVSTKPDCPALQPGEAVQIGSSGPDNWLGMIAAVGVWKQEELSDGQLEGLTADIASWEALTPTALWLLNQTDVGDDVIDITGNGADQASITGTSVSAVADLAFDVGEAADTGLAWFDI